MQSILAVTIGLSMLALASAASADDSTAASGCPKRYVLLGDICMSAASGDIVLPTKEQTTTASQTGAGR